MALQFPPKLDPDNSENPVVDLHTEDNGVSYYWDPASNSWILVSAQTVTKDYVDNRDELRYRRDGSDFIYGNFIIRKQSDFAVDPSVIITTQGTVMLSDNNEIMFSSQSDNLPSLSYGVVDNRTKVLSFDSNFVLPLKPFRYSTDAGDRIFLVENDGANELVLFDVQPAAGITYTSTIIRIPNSKNDKFVISSNDGTESGLMVKGDGSVVVLTQTQKSFTIRCTEGQSDLPFTVEANSHKLFASKEYSEALTRGGGQVTGSGGKEYHDFDEKNLLTTKQYVDAQNKTEPGFNNCADNEASAESGGFWRSGSNLFWKI